MRRRSTNCAVEKDRLESALHTGERAELQLSSLEITCKVRDMLTIKLHFIRLSEGL